MFDLWKTVLTSPIWVSRRLSFWRDALVRPWVGLILVLWSLFSNAATIRDNFLTPEVQKHWQTLGLIPKWPWWVWIIGTLILLLLTVLEGAYRVVEKKGGIIESLLAELATFKNRLDERQERRRTKNELGEFLASGQALLQSAPQKDDADFEGRVIAWVESVRSRLSGANLAMFLDDSGMVFITFSFKDGYAFADDRMKNYLSHRLQRLREYLERLPND